MKCINCTSTVSIAENRRMCNTSFFNVLLRFSKKCPRSDITAVKFQFTAPSSTAPQRPPLTRGQSAKLTGGEKNQVFATGFSPSGPSGHLPHQGEVGRSRATATNRQIPIYRILQQERYRAGPGRNETYGTMHAMSVSKVIFDISFQNLLHYCICISFFFQPA